MNEERALRGSDRAIEGAVPPAFLLFFDWFGMPRWQESEFADRLDWSRVGTQYQDQFQTVDFYFKQFEYIHRIGIDNVAWEFSFSQQAEGPPYSCIPVNALEALRQAGMKVAPHFDLELSFQAFDQANFVPELNSPGRIKPDLGTVHFIYDGLRAFYERVPPEAIGRDRNGDVVIFIYGFGFNDDGSPEDWSGFADILIASTAALVGPKFKFYWSCTSKPFQEHLFLHYRRHFTPYNFVLDTPQSQFSHDSVTWNFGFDNLYVLQHYKSTRVVRLDPRYVEEPAWLAAASDPALIFIYGWNEPFEGSFLFPSERWGDEKAQICGYYLRALKSHPPERLMTVLLIVDDLSAARRSRPNDWHLDLLREMMLYRMRLFAPQADVAMPGEVDEALLDAYDGIIDLTFEKDARVVALIKSRWNVQRAMLFDPLASTRGGGYAEQFLQDVERVQLDRAVPIVGSNATVFVRDDVANGDARPDCAVHLSAELDDHRQVPLVVSDGKVTFVNSYGNADTVMCKAFEQFYGRPMASSILYGERHATQRFEQTADGTVLYNRLVRRSVNERWRMPEWADWNRLPPAIDPSHAAFVFGSE